MKNEEELRRYANNLDNEPGETACVPPEFNEVVIYGTGSTGTGGNITLTAGTATSGSGGSITLLGGNSSGGCGGDITLTSGNGTWK